MHPLIYDPASAGQKNTRGVFCPAGQGILSGCHHRSETSCENSSLQKPRCPSSSDGRAISEGDRDLPPSYANLKHVAAENSCEAHDLPDEPEWISVVRNTLEVSAALQGIGRLRVQTFTAASDKRFVITPNVSSSFGQREAGLHNNQPALHGMSGCGLRSICVVL